MCRRWKARTIIIFFFKVESMENLELSKGAAMSEEMAEKEVELWFDARRVKPKNRNSVMEELGYDPQRRALVDGFEYGSLTFDPETKILTLNLSEPILKKDSKEVLHTKLDFKVRLKQHEIEESAKGVKAKDTTGRIKAYMSALTGVSIGLLNRMDSDDYSLASTIITYFL